MKIMNKSIALVVKLWLSRACSVGGKLCLTISPTAIETQCQCITCLCECLLYITMWAHVCGLSGRMKAKRGATEGGKQVEPASLWQVKVTLNEAAPQEDLLGLECSSFSNMGKYNNSPLSYLASCFYTSLINKGTWWDANSQIRDIFRVEREELNSCGTAAAAKHVYNSTSYGPTLM